MSYSGTDGTVPSFGDPGEVELEVGVCDDVVEVADEDEDRAFAHSERIWTETWTPLASTPVSRFPVPYPLHCELEEVTSPLYVRKIQTSER